MRETVVSQTIEMAPLPLALRREPLVERAQIDHHPPVRPVADLFQLVARRHLELDPLAFGLDHLGFGAVGTAIDVKHLAATPVGHTVRAEAEVIKAEGKRIEFKVSARDELEEIGNGTHRRMVINLRSFNERLAAKGKR